MRLFTESVMFALAISLAAIPAAQAQNVPHIAYALPAGGQQGTTVLVKIGGQFLNNVAGVYVSGPGGLWILSPEGKHLGTIIGPEHPHNFAWGDDDGRTLYLAARTGLYRIRLGIPGLRP